MKFNCIEAYGGVDPTAEGEVRYNDGVASCYILSRTTPFADSLVTAENSAWLRFTSEYKNIDPTINEGVQLHGPMVTWWILDLFIFAEQLDVPTSKIIMPKQYIAQLLRILRDLPMIVVQS